MGLRQPRSAKHLPLLREILMPTGDPFLCSSGFSALIGAVAGSRSHG